MKEMANHVTVMGALQLWKHAIHYVAEIVLEGVAKLKGRCSAIGRSTMSSGMFWSPCTVLVQGLWYCKLTYLACWPVTEQLQGLAIGNMAMQTWKK